jgi:hypothetical protein
MAYTRVKLIDVTPPPHSLGAYSWYVNYQEESGFGGRRDLEISANTAGTGVIIQQGGEQPVMISLTGKFPTKAQHQAFIAFFRRCQVTTVHFVDFEDQRYEVIITAYDGRRVRAARNLRGGNDAKLHYYEYTMEMQVLRTISGDWTIGVAA